MASRGAISTNLIRFGDEFELDLRAYELRRSGQLLKLERIPMALLLLLIEQRGQPVSRDQIVERVWGKDVFLDTDNSINAAIRKIRQVLKDDPEQPRFVQTLTGRGYRFIAPVEEFGPSAVDAIGSSAPGQPHQDLIGKKIGNYRVLQLLGGGGMGVVYQAEDLKLGRRVAIKFLPSELATDPKAFERLEREARAASALDHPNICPIYHLGEHEGQPFIVMQLLEGQTLREWIEGPVNRPAAQRIGQALDLAIEIVDGLEAAHQKGIIHSDIKPANIFITNRGHAKILDFGIAKFGDTAESADQKVDLNVVGDRDETALADPHLTRSGSIGTPPYLSPEQIGRERLDARTDLFSFGLVLYEMVTGERAFSGSTAGEIRAAVLNRPPAALREVVPEAPEKLEQIVSQALTKDREHRYQNAAAIREDLQYLKSILAASAVETRPHDVRTLPSAKYQWNVWRVLLAAIALLAVVLGGYVLVRSLRSSREAATATLQTRRSVAVLGFDNLNGHPDKEWLSTGLSEMLTTELGAGGKLRLIPGEDIARAKSSLHISDAASMSKFNLGRLRNNLGADLVVYGAYTVLDGGDMRLDLRLQDAKSGETLAALAETGSEKRLFDLVSLTGADMRQRLGAGAAPASAKTSIQASLPSDPEAARWYAEGLEKLRVFDFLEARDLLLRASELDPSHAATHAALASAWRNLGYDAKAQEEAQKAVDLSANLGREDRLWVEGQAQEARHEWQKAASTYGTLFQMYPDSLEYGLRLGSAQASAGSFRDALATVDSLRKLPSPERDDARIDLLAANALDQMGDHNQQLSLALRAEQTARAQESTLVTARALALQCDAHRNLGEFKLALSTCEQAQRLFSDAGDRSLTAGRIDSIALLLRDQGDLAGAKTKFQEALTIVRRIGDKRNEARYSNNLANILSDHGEFAEAKKMFERSLNIAMEVGDKRGAINTLGNIGLTLQRMGDLAGAGPKFEAALALAREVGNKQSEASQQIHLAELRYSRGDLEGTTRALESADSLLQGSGDKRHHLYALYSWGDLLSAEDDLAGARKKLEEALSIANEIGAKDLIAFSQMTLGELTIHEGRASDSVPMLQGSRDEFRAEKSPDFEIEALHALADALLQLGRTQEAASAVHDANALLSEVPDPLTRLDMSMVSARLAAALGKPLDAERFLQSVTAEAHKRGAVVAEFDARLAQGEIEVASAQRNVGEAHLRSLQKEAQARGFLLTARKAGVAMDTRH
jgi:serine/threonine protein kinase/tetratricopeptide (TPR) repeat protein